MKSAGTLSAERSANNIITNPPYNCAEALEPGCSSLNGSLRYFSA